VFCFAILLAASVPVPAAEPTRKEVDELKRLLEQQEQSIRDLKARNPAARGKPGAPARAPQRACGRRPAETETGAAPAPAEEAEARIFGRRNKIPDTRSGRPPGGRRAARATT
jgi:hypothetical protein